MGRCLMQVRRVAAGHEEPLHLDCQRLPRTRAPLFPAWRGWRSSREGRRGTLRRTCAGASPGIRAAWTI